MHPTVSPIQVMNRETGAYHDLYIRADRLISFFDFVTTLKSLSQPAINMPGVSAAAVTGMSAIFTYVPPKFPVESILYFLAAQQDTYIGGEKWRPVSPLIMELALEKFGQTVRLLRGDGSVFE